MTKRQFLAPLAILPVAALALTGCSTQERASDDAAKTAPAVVSTAGTVPADGPVHSLEPKPEGEGHGEAKAGEGAHSAGTVDVVLKKADGSSAGKATFTAKGNAVVIDVQVTGLTAGFHGMHIHSVGKCEANSVAANGAPGSAGDFNSAGGHWQKAGATGHPMTGDLVSIFVNANGTGNTVTTTSAFTLDDLKENTAGNALIIHSGPDNFGNIDSRYSVNGQPGPDQRTLDTGDAGTRVACGVIKVG